jgi:sodium-dependent dicarboxylate transporter 2/3/5
MALAMQRWGLHERLALTVVSLVGSRPDRLVLGFMLATAGLSMWISNTATVVMMLPIALSVVELVRRQSRAEGSAAASDEPGARSDFAICLLLGLAYSASIGGMATLIGTPPNLMLSAFVADRYDMDLTMSAWLPLGLTLVVILLPLTWFLLVRVLYPVGREAARGSGDLIRQRLTDLGTMTRPERRVLVVFVSAALLWIFRGRLTAIELFGGQPLAGLTDPGIAVLASIFLFALPAGKASEGERETPYEPLLTWRGALALPWGILLLFGGGLSLAWCIVAASVDVFIGQAISYLDWIPPLAFIALVAAVVLFLTEITSNTATTATFLPIVAAAADGLGMSPLELLVPMTLAASCAFMMPVATPPNAIVFGSGEITIPQMCRAGIWLNLIALVVIMVVTQLVPLGGI